MPAEELFKFPTYYNNASDDLKDNIYAQIDEKYLSKIEWDKIDLHSSVWNGQIDSAYTTLGSSIDNLIDYYGLIRLESFILSSAREYLDYCGWSYEGVKIENSWSVIGTKGSVQGHHTHGYGCGFGQISGVYYVAGVPTELGGRLNIQSPYRPLQKNTFPFGSKCWDQIWYDARPGRVVMFPAWMTHWVSPIYLENYKRITIAFNVTAY